MRNSQIVNDKGEIEKAGCVVVNDKGQILLVTNKDRTVWGLPKGHAEVNESSEAVAVRETREETGHEVEILKYVGDMTYVNGQTGEPIRVHYYLAKPTLQHDTAEEEWEWVDINRAKTLVPSSTKEFLDHVNF